MPRTGLTPEEIREKAIDATLERMRQHGFDRVRVTDVAQDLDLSHAALYGYFADKAALLDAVTERWLIEANLRLAEVCRAQKDPIEKIHDWFLTLYRLKRERVRRDPEPYRAYDMATAVRKPFVVEHLAAMKRQLAGLIEETEGALGSEAPEQSASLLFEAMSAFHHPKLVAAHASEDREPQLMRLLGIVLAGLAAGR